MNLRQQIIQDRVDALADQLHVASDQAFTRLAFSLVSGTSVHAFDPDVLVDGGQDKQIDVLSLEPWGETADVYILQTKNSPSFSSNALVQLANGLKWVFQRSRAELDTLDNIALRDKIHEYRALQNSLGPSNLRVYVRFVTNGLTAGLSAEFNQELAAIRTDYGTDTFEHFSVEALGCDDLVDLSKAQDRHERSVDADIRIRYDANNPSLIKYYAQGLKGLVVSVPASEIARLVNNNPDGAIFDLNIRRFLGARGGVNRDIQASCTNVGLSYQFWFLNNGITIACDHCDPITDPDNPVIKLRNLQIVNGCQTATTLALAQREGRLAADARVLARIYETSDPDFVGRIVLTTNNQNQITGRDLRANEPVQLDMEAGFRIYDYWYERKPRQYDTADVDPNRLFTNEYVGQAYLAIVLRAPSDGRARKYKVWGELHSKVFAGDAIEPYIISAIVARRAGEWLRRSPHAAASDEIERLVAKRGTFFLARIAAFLWHGNDEWRRPGAELKTELQRLEQSPDALDGRFPEAWRILLSAVRAVEPQSADVDRAMRSSQLDTELDSRLHKNRADD